MKSEVRIERVTDPKAGPLDGVSLLANAVVTYFQTDKHTKARKIGTQKVFSCKLMASYEEGTVSVSIQEKDLMVSVRIDELVALMKEAATASLDTRCPVHLKRGGPYSLYCEKCHCWIPNTANHEMKKEGCFAHSHVCGDLSNGEIADNEAQKGVEESNE